MMLRGIRAALRRLRFIRGFAAPLRAFSRRAPTDSATGAASCQLPETRDEDGSAVVLIRAYPFHPATVYDRRGRITWLNCGTATTMHTTGTFTYRCEPQPFMTGSVIVE